MKTVSVFFQGNQLESSSLYACGIVEHVGLTDYYCAISNPVTKNESSYKTGLITVSTKLSIIKSFRVVRCTLGGRKQAFASFEETEQG